MSKQLYEEALADARQLRLVAEDNAKRALVEAVTPRIRDLIERELLREFDEDFENEDYLDAPLSNKLPVDDMLTDDETVVDASAISLPDDEGKVTLDLDAVGTDLPGSPVESPMFGSSPLDDEYELSVESIDALSTLSKKGQMKVVESNIKNIGTMLERVSVASPIVKESNGYLQKITQMISQVENTYEHVQEVVIDPAKKNEFELKLETYFQELNRLQEHKKMSKRNKRNMNEGDVTLKLTGLPDDLDLDSVGVDLITGDEDEGGDGDFDLDDGGGDESEDFDLDVDDTGDSDEDFDVQESDDLSDDTVVEIDESMLRREIARMKKLRETHAVPSVKGHGAGNFDSFGGGKDDGEALDVNLTTESDEEDLDDDSSVEAKTSTSAGPTSEARRLAFEKRLQERLTARKAKLQREARHAIAKKDSYELSMIKKEHKLVESRLVESQNRTTRLKKNILESRTNRSVSQNAKTTKPAERTAESTNLRNKLAETNLFNAKLVYTNKLLQNESLSKKQKAGIIERLDEAKNIREVKLVYDSLTKTLSGTSKPLSESKELQTGSSSRATRSSGMPINEGYETNRWAKLAGIK